MPKLIRPDGTEYAMPAKPTLEQLQKAVGGYIEYVPTSSGGFLYINEEGKIMGMPVNPTATALVRDMIGSADFIVGPAVVYTPEEAEEA